MSEKTVKRLKRKMEEKLKKEELERQRQRYNILVKLKRERENRKEIFVANNPEIIEMTNTIDKNYQIVNKHLSLAETVVEARDVHATGLIAEFDEKDPWDDSELQKLEAIVNPISTYGAGTIPWNTTTAGNQGTATISGSALTGTLTIGNPGTIFNTSTGSGITLNPFPNTTTAP